MIAGAAWSWFTVIIDLVLLAFLWLMPWSISLSEKLWSTGIVLVQLAGTLYILRRIRGSR